MAGRNINLMERSSEMRYNQLRSLELRRKITILKAEALAQTQKWDWLIELCPWATTPTLARIWIEQNSQSRSHISQQWLYIVNQWHLRYVEFKRIRKELLAAFPDVTESVNDTIEYMKTEDAQRRINKDLKDDMEPQHIEDLYHELKMSAITCHKMNRWWKAGIRALERHFDLHVDAVERPNVS